MSAAQVRDIGIRISDALAAAHAAGVLHRDIKPANILVNRYGLVGLSDFGLAAIMAAGGEQSTTREALTPAYASPETFRCEEPTVAADLYSLGATLYALLTGRPPRFPADSRSPDIATIIALHDRPVDDVPGVPPGLMDILRRGLATDPAARPPSAAALRDALAALPAQPGRPAPPGRPGPGTRRPTPMAAASQPHRAPQPSRSHPAPSSPPRHHMPSPHHTPSPHPSYPAPQMHSIPQAHPTPQAHRATARAPLRTPPASGPRGAPAGTAPAMAHRRRPARLLAAAAAVVVVLIGVAALAGTRLLSHGTGAAPASPPVARPALRSAAAPAPGVFGIPTVTNGCPAAAVSAAAARCPRNPECWNGLVEISGSVTARSLRCARPHIWETFAIAILPAGVRTFDQQTVEQNPVVSAVCSMRVLLKSRLGAARQIPRTSWKVEVMPPDEAAFGSGDRAYRCLAHRTSAPDPSTAQFGQAADRGGRAPGGRGGPGSGKNG
jgi:hypothetical protein